MLTLILLAPLAGVGLVIWGVIDAATRPEWAWQRSGQNKGLWIALQVVGALVCLGVIPSIIYLAAIRSKVRSVQDGISTTSPPPFGMTPPGWYSDQTQPGKMRYWDGAAWTSHVL